MRSSFSTPTIAPGCAVISKASSSKSAAPRTSPMRTPAASTTGYCGKCRFTVRFIASAMVSAGASANGSRSITPESGAARSPKRRSRMVTKPTSRSASSTT